MLEDPTGAHATWLFPVPDRMPGDLDGDGAVTEWDVTLVCEQVLEEAGARYKVHSLTAAEDTAKRLDALAAADLNGDGRIDRSDLAAPVFAGPALVEAVARSLEEIEAAFGK
jgi:hypothetical protein